MALNTSPTTMSRICMYTPSAEGGMAQYAWELLHALAAARPDHRFELVSGSDLEPQFKSAAYTVSAVLPPLRHRNEFCCRATWVASRLAHYPMREWAFRRWLKRRPDIDAVHFQEWTPWLAAPQIRRIQRMGKKVFFTVHNVVPHKYPLGVPKALMNRWIRNACLACDGLFVHTDPLAAQLSASLGEPHPPIQVVPHGVWTVRDNANGPTMRDRLSWKKLLFFGSIRRNKGLDVLLRAAEHLPGYQITIAGEPHEQQYYEEEILPLIAWLRTAGVSIDLRPSFTPDDQIPALFAQHSAVMLPYTRDFVAQSGVIFMALAHEMPVVASEAGGLRDLFNNYRIGEIFHDHTPESLAAAVKSLHAAPDPAALLREIRQARQRFSWKAAANATLAGYARAGEGRSAANDCAAQTTPAL